MHKLFLVLGLTSLSMFLAACNSSSFTGASSTDQSSQTAPIANGPVSVINTSNPNLVVTPVNPVQPIIPIEPTNPVNPIPPVDPLCDSTSTAIYYPNFLPLTAPNLPNECKNGFEVNNMWYGYYDISSKTTTGSRAITLDIQVATYVAPDDISIWAINQSGTATRIFHTCLMRTYDTGDPTPSPHTIRPPDVTIRQWRVALPSGTRGIRLDNIKATSPHYVRILGLCDFNLVPSAILGAQWRAVN